MSRNNSKPGNKKLKANKPNRKRNSRKTGAKGAGSASPEKVSSAKRKSGKLQTRSPGSEEEKLCGPDAHAITAHETPNSATCSPDTEPARAAERLRESLKSKVSVQCDEIAQALINTAKKGNMTGARLLVELTGADRPTPEKKNQDVAQLNILDPEFLAGEPEWKDPEVGDVWVGNHWESPSKPSHPDA